MFGRIPSVASFLMVAYVARMVVMISLLFSIPDWKCFLFPFLLFSTVDTVYSSFLFTVLMRSYEIRPDGQHSCYFRFPVLMNLFLFFCKRTS
jgi:hypothetical protein